MATTIYFAAIDVVTRDADGYFTPLVGESIIMRRVGGSDIDTFTTGDDGFLAAGSTFDTPGVEIEFYSATKTGTLRQIAAATADEAFTAHVTLILDDAFVTTKDSKYADIYVKDTGESGVPLVFLSSQKKGTTQKYAGESAFSKHLDIIAHSRTEDNIFASANISDAPFDSLTPPSTRPADVIEIDLTGIVGGAIGKGLYHKSDHTIGEFTIISGTVTSVGLSLPSIFSVSGSPVTGAGTLAASLANQSANLIFAGPTSGGAAAPTFRSLVADDIPSLDSAKITSGTLAAARLGSGSGGSSKFLREDSTWQTVSVSPAGSNTQVQLNNSGVFGASSGLTYDGTTLKIGGATLAGAMFLQLSSGGFNVNELKYIDWGGSGRIGADYTIGEGLGANINLKFFTGSDMVNPALAIGANKIVRFYAPPEMTQGLTVSNTADPVLTLKRPSGTGGDYLIIGGTYPETGAKSIVFTDSFNAVFSRITGTQDGAGNSHIDFTLSGVGTLDSNPSIQLWSAGRIGIGLTSIPSAALQVRKTTEQQRLEYDGSNYFKTTVGSTGGVIFDAVGSGAKFNFSDDVEIADAKNLIFGTTTGTKLGTSTSQKIGFFNATPVTQRSDVGTVIIGALPGGDTVDIGTLNDALTDINSVLAGVRTALRDLGLMA